MIKRIIPLALAVALCVCAFSLPVLAADSEVQGNKVIDYIDYITAYDLYNPTDGWAYIRVDPALIGSMCHDKNGQRQFTNGLREFSMTIDVDDGAEMGSSTYYPGGFLTKSYMKLANIPQGSSFWMQWNADVFLDGKQFELHTRLRTGIIYYDANFNQISVDYDDKEITIDAEDARITRILEKEIVKPEGAEYCSFYFATNFTLGRSNERDEITVRQQFESPSLKMSTSYTQIIIQGIVNARPPENGGAILDVDDLEDYLQGSTQNGREEADIIFDEAPDSILAHAEGFLFLAMVFDAIISVGWIRGILVVSLALGILGFIANIASQVGRSIEHRNKSGGGTK